MGAWVLSVLRDANLRKDRGHGVPRLPPARLGGATRVTSRVAAVPRPACVPSSEPR